MEFSEKLMESKLQERDETEAELATECMQKACKYTNYRMQWIFSSLEEKRATDNNRTIAHDSFMCSAKIYLRYMINHYPDVQFFQQMQEEFFQKDRKELGDIACKIAYDIAISMR